MPGISERNPFVGPRSIQQGEPLYGRSSEVRELYNRLQARRIVVLHSPSGAGKSSLVQAGLMPRLKEGGFDVWKPIRVNLDPGELSGVAVGSNRFRLSALLSLEEELPAERRRSPAELAGMDLLAYLEGRPRRKGRADRSVVLLFDQFEEVLTTAPRDVEAKRAFFSEVGRALDSGPYWALFILREDYLGAFAPYRDLIPTQMANTFRLDLLGLAGAREVAEQLALKGGRSFPAVDRLIRDLSTVQVQQTDGTFLPEQGLYVEPVQLQVVCRRLWAEMPEDDLIIDEDDIARYADVSRALAGYFALAVAGIAGGDVSIERALREWVGSRLIVGGIRAQVRQAAGQSAGLDNQLIGELLGSYLVRTEQRAGANWFELSHDRLVEPVLQDNRVWEQANLHPLQIQARMWESERRADSALLSAEALVVAEAWVPTNARLLTESEEDFLQRSRKLRAEETLKKQVQRLFAATMTLVAIVSIFLGLRVRSAKGEAEATSRLASDRLAHMLEDQGREALVVEDDPQRAAIYLAESYAVRPQDPVTRFLLARAIDLGVDAALATLPGSTASLWSARFSSDGSRVITASADGVLRLWDAHSWALLSQWESEQDNLRDAELTLDGTHVLAYGGLGVERWDARTQMLLGTYPDGGDRRELILGPDGALLLTVTLDGRYQMRDANSGAALWTLPQGRGAAADSLVDAPPRFSPDGRRVLVLSGASAELRDAHDGSLLVTYQAHKQRIRFSSFSPDGSLLFTAGEDRMARVWSTPTGVELRSFSWPNVGIREALFSPDRSLVLTISDLQAALWRVSDGSRVDPPMAHSERITDGEFSPDGLTLLTTGFDGKLRLWDGHSGAAMATLVGHEGPIVSGRYSPDGRQILTASEDGSARIWDARAGQPWRLVDGQGAPDGQGSEVHGLDFSPDGRQVLTLSGDGLVRVWEAERLEAERLEAERGVEETGESSSSWNQDAPVEIALFSPDGRGLLTVGPAPDSFVPDDEGSPSAVAESTPRVGGAVARLWDLQSGSKLASFEGQSINAASFSPDGRRALLLCQGEVLLWDLVTGAPPRPLGQAGAAESIVAASFSPDGSRVLMLDIVGAAGIWNVATGALELSLKDPEGLFLAAEFSPNGALVATGGDDHLARLWDAHTGTLRSVLRGHRLGVTGVRFSPDGSRLLSQSADETTRLWDTETGTALVRIGRRKGLKLPIFSPDGARVASASWTDGAILLWDAHTGALLQAIGGTGRVDEATRTWDMPTGTQVVETIGVGARASPVFSPNGNRLLTAGAGGRALLWDTQLESRPPEEISRLVRCKIPFKILKGALVPVVLDEAACSSSPE